jgi:nitrogen fixation-related uncharacterized protein
MIALLMGILIGYETFWWSGALVGAAVIAFFLWAPGSGRYLDEPEGGTNPLRLDERMAAIRDRAARDGFVVLMLSLAALVLYFGLFQPGDIPFQWILGVTSFGFLAYFISDALRRQPVGR